MAQYERFLSYLFEYSGDAKGKNCGFAKIEVRGDIKRIQITVKGRTPVELLHVCGFYRENGRCTCVPLGRMMINGGSGQFQYVTTGEWIRGSHISFDQLRGLVLSNPNETGQAYATVWDDEPFGLSMFEQETGQEEQEPEKEESQETGQEEQEPEKEESQETGREEQEPEKEESQETGREEQNSEEKEFQETERTVQEPEDAQILQAESCGSQEEGRSQEEADLFWAGLCRRFRKIEALPQDDIVCLKAMPADIGRLPRPNWIYGSNGFLMYSYVRFRYIVFARVSREAFELWLPGTYGKNEELLAEMFGFFRFRSMKSSKPQQGDFGYWCVPLSVPLGKDNSRAPQQQPA